MDDKRVFGPIPLDIDEHFTRADLEFYRIDHFRPSFTTLLFFNDADVTPDNASEERDSYAGRFSIFGHQRCAGSEGHCEVHEHLRRFDDRPSHPLTRAFKRVVVTDALRRCLTTQQLMVTALTFTDPAEEMEFHGRLLDFEGMQLVTFE